MRRDIGITPVALTAMLAPGGDRAGRDPAGAPRGDARGHVPRRGGQGGRRVTGGGGGTRPGRRVGIPGGCGRAGRGFVDLRGTPARRDGRPRRRAIAGDGAAQERGRAPCSGRRSLRRSAAQGSDRRPGTSRFRQDGGVRRAFFTPDGKTLFTVGWGEAPRLGGRHGALVHAIDAGEPVPSRDGKTLFGGSRGSSGRALARRPDAVRGQVRAGPGHRLLRRRRTPSGRVQPEGNPLRNCPSLPTARVWPSWCNSNRAKTWGPNPDRP